MVNDAIRIFPSNSRWSERECLKSGQPGARPGCSQGSTSRQLSVLSEFLLSAKIVRNGASSSPARLSGVTRDRV